MSPIYLEAPQYQPGGPDGQGWNRIAIHPLGVEPECALQPTSYATLVESQDTRRAHWGGFGRCIAKGRCDGCVVMNAEPVALEAFSERVLVRVLDGRPYLMNRPEDGWASRAYRRSWAELGRLDGWSVGDSYSDEHGEGFWLIRESA